MGFGETFISMALAQELLESSDQYSSLADALGLDANGEEVGDSPENVDTDGVTTDVEVTDSPQILVMRQSGMGWGEIAKELGFNLGEVVNAIHSSRPDRSEPAEKSKHRSRPENTGRPERGRGIERGNRPERPEKIERPDKPERPEKPERPQKPEKPSRPGRG